MAREFPLVPELVETVSTRHRKLEWHDSKS